MHGDLVFVSPETMRLFGAAQRNEHVLLISEGKDQQRTLAMGLLWPSSTLGDNQVSVSRVVIDRSPGQSMMEIRTIPKDLLRTTTSITLR